jgi:hypothetical protein
MFTFYNAERNRAILQRWYSEMERGNKRPIVLISLSCMGSEPHTGLHTSEEGADPQTLASILESLARTLRMGRQSPVMQLDGGLMISRALRQPGGTPDR